LLDGLREIGHQVDEINAPLGFTTAERVAMLAKPWTGYRMLTRLLQRWSSLILRRLRSRSSRSPDAVIVGYLGHFDVILARLLFPRTLIALDLLIFAADTALDRGVRQGPKLRALAMLDRLAIKCADLVIVDTDQHAQLLTVCQRSKAVIAPVGSPDQWFAKPDPDASSDRLRVVFFGLFTPLQGAPVIGQAIAQLPPGTAIDITMIGTGQDLEETRKLAAGTVPVTWHEWVEPGDLQKLVHQHDVCLGIFGQSAKALRVVPNKVFQGAAAGCVILTSDTPPQRHALGDDAYFVAGGDPGALAHALRSLADNPDEVRRLRAAAYERAEAEFRPRQVSQPLEAALVAGTMRKRPR
jgi:glycosyltransferase involved in cell wall biosynthesis